VEATRRLAIVGALALLAVLILRLQLFAADPEAAHPEPAITSDRPSPAEGGLDEAFPVAPADRTPVQSIVRVRDRAHRPVGRALVLVLDPAMEPVQRATANADGIASFGGLDGDGGLLAVSESGAHGLLLGIHLAGEHEVVLDDSAIVAGVVLVDGQPAPEGLELTLTTDLPALPANAPESLLETIDGAATQRITRTRAGGAFAFDGLSPSWRGRLLPPPTHWRTDVESDMFGAAHRSMGLETPRRDVRLELTQLPTATGRVVWDDTGEGIGGAHVTAHAKTKDGAAAWGSSLTGADGTFAIGLTPTTGGRQRAWIDASLRPALDDLRVSCPDANGSAGPCRIEVDLAKAKEPIELRVRRAETQYFVAEDENGQPIERAEVDRPACTRTDAMGRGSWRGGEAKFVGAPEHSVVPARALDGDGSAARPFRFVIPRDCRLLVVVRDLPAAARTAAQIVVESTTPLLAGGTKWPNMLQQRFGTSDWSGASRRRTTADGTTEEVLEVRCRAPRRGPARLSSLEPDTACEVRLEDSLGRTLASTRTRTPALGNVLEIELAAGASARLVSGRVLDTNGQPLESAEVRLTSDRDTAYASTTRDGRFAVLASGSAAMQVRVMLTGYVMQERGLEPDRPATQLEFRLARGRTALVRVIDARGQAVEMYGYPLGFELLQGQRLSPGAWRWSDLPAEVEFATALQGKRWTVRCAAEETDAVLRVPELATLAVTPWKVTDGRGIDASTCVVELRSVDAPEREVVRVGLGGEGDREQLLLPGRYVATVVKQLRGGASTAQDPASVGITAEVIAVAGARVELRFP